MAELLLAAPFILVAVFFFALLGLALQVLGFLIALPFKILGFVLRFVFGLLAFMLLLPFAILAGVLGLGGVALAVVAGLGMLIAPLLPVLLVAAGVIWLIKRRPRPGIAA